MNSKSILQLSAFSLAATFGFLKSASTLAADANCDDYAKTAVEHANQNLASKCGLKGGRWTTDAKSHHDWCMKHASTAKGQKLIASENDQRDQLLNKCKSNK